MTKFIKGLTTFFICMGAITVSGLLYNHVHWLLGMASLGAFVYGLIQYRHWLFPDLPK